MEKGAREGEGKWGAESLENLNQSVEWDADVVGSAITAEEITRRRRKGEARSKMFQFK